MVIERSLGVTKTERLLAELCDKTFLKLWAYLNPYNDKQVELCDLLAVFENHVFIFFDRESLILNNANQDPQVSWNRWKKKVIDAQIRTANGAEKYIRSNRHVFLDQAKSKKFPIDIASEDLVIHKIIVAHGAAGACKSSSEDNISGSLAISYGDSGGGLRFPFFIDLDKESPVHIFDSHNLPIVLSELDTFYDFTSYLEAKVAAIKQYDFLSYCGEEDLVAHYFMNFDQEANNHFIGSQDEESNGFFLGEGVWEHFIQRDEYLDRKKANQVSYLWDEIIQRTCDYTLSGEIKGSNPMFGRSAIHEMAKEPRFIRRVLSKRIGEAIRSFPENSNEFVRKVSLMSSFYKGKSYIFLQLKAVGLSKSNEEYREKKRALLQIACGSAKNKFPHLTTIIGIGISAPKYSETNSEDFILMDCSNWSDSDRQYYEEANVDLRFFETENLTMGKLHATEFPASTEDELFRTKKVGRNDKCPCGSGNKYKKCCIGIKRQ